MAQALTQTGSTRRVMRTGLWAYEARRVGWPVLATPAAVIAGVIAVAAVMTEGGAPRHAVVRLVVAGLEVMLPLAAAIGATELVGRDRAVELHLSLPTPYRVTLLRRLAITLAWPALLAAASTAVLHTLDWWAPTHSGAAGVLVWLAPLFWLPALGVFLAVLLRNATAASGLIAGLWLVEQLFAAAFAASAAGRAVYLFPATWLAGIPGWPVNRAVLLTTAVALLAGTWALLARPHRLLTEEDA
jgi:hypothetical protein